MPRRAGQRERLAGSVMVACAPYRVKQDDGLAVCCTEHRRHIRAVQPGAALVVGTPAAAPPHAQRRLHAAPDSVQPCRS